MHNHVDRDKFIDINWNNIKPNKVSNFVKVDSERFGNFGTGYDIYSVTHYAKNAFSKNRNDTIRPMNSRSQKYMGQRKGITRGDAERINNMYECSQRVGFFY